MQFDIIFAEERSERLAQIPRLKEMAAAGDIKAQIELAWELAEGRIIDADFGEATRLFERAAASGDPDAQLYAARFLYLRRVPAGLRSIRAFALKDNIKAQFWLGRHYQFQKGRINQLRAVVWYKRAQQNGSLPGRFALLGQQVRVASFFIKPLLVIKNRGNALQIYAVYSIRSFNRRTDWPYTHPLEESLILQLRCHLPHEGG